MTVPNHIAFIPDGNRRWAKKNLFEAIRGHEKGADILMDVVKAGKDAGVKVMTFYLFSTENWNRPKREIDKLMHLLERYLITKRQEMVENGVKLHSIGDLSPFPKSVLTELAKTKEATEACKQVDLVFALNYGGRDEIRRAVQKIVDAISENKLNRESISEEVIAKYMDTCRWKDPDLLIRTSGEMRISNFLLWQLSYTEVHVTQVLWPDFGPKDLSLAIAEYQKRDRRLGGG